MVDEGKVRRQLLELAELAEAVSDLFGREMPALAMVVAGVLEDGGRLFFCGNGGSAADAQHLAAEYVVRFNRQRKAFSAVALTTDTSVLTAAANDFGFESVFSRQLEGLARPGDLLFLHSTSGESENLLRAADTARELHLQTVAFLAKGGGRLAQRVEKAFVIPTQSTARAQEIHLALGHILCDLVEERLSGEAQ